MGNQKLKWTAEEEETLLAGVGKHGPGKWKNILRDPDFAEKLSQRSNIDLKDKWRNLSVDPCIQGSKDKVRTPKLKAAAYALSKPCPLPPLPRTPPHDSINDDKIVLDPKNAPRYDGMIFEALSTLADHNGSDVGAIFNFIEQKHHVPTNFRRILSSRLRRLAAQCKLVKVSQFHSGTQNFYKMNDNSLGTRTPAAAVRPKEITVKPRPTSIQGPAVSLERLGQASITAAYKLVEVENKQDVVKGAVEETDRMIRLADRSDVILLLAREMLEQCSQGMMVELA